MSKYIEMLLTQGDNSLARIDNEILKVKEK